MGTTIPSAAASMAMVPPLVTCGLADIRQGMCPAAPSSLPAGERRGCCASPPVLLSLQLRTGRSKAAVNT